MEIEENSSSIIDSLLVKTLYDDNEINILPQYRLKTRQTNLIPSICFYNGSFVPIHRGHINVLEEAKQYINNLGTHELLGAYISPSHSGYITRKLNSEQTIGVGHRLSMIYLAIENLDWVMVDLFQIFQKQNTHLFIIMEEFISRVRCQLPNGREIDVFWLQGEDALAYIISSNRILRLGFHSLYVINRECIKNNQLKSTENYYDKKWKDIQALSSFPEKLHLIHTKHMNLSSSNIRTYACKPSITYEQLQLTTQLDSITNYIFQHHLWRIFFNDLSITIPILPVFPRKITDITPKVLSTMFSSYSKRSVNVISFDSKQIGIGKGWSGRLYQFYNIQYTYDNIDNLPKSIILKLSNGIWNNIIASIEPEFYLNIAPRISNIKIPKYYYLGRHPYSSRESLLLLEDLSINYTSIDSLKDSTIFSIISSIATLHAEFYKHLLFKQDTFVWLPSLNSMLNHYQNRYEIQMTNERYTQLLKLKVSDKAYAYAKILIRHLPHIFQRLTDQNYTLSHGDFRINNIFIRRNQPHEMVLFDWQTCWRANGLIDVAFFLRSFPRERARSLEPKILEVYHQVLVKYGVLNYDAFEIFDDYYSLALPFIFVMHSSWIHLKEDELSEIILILEDIILYTNNTKQITCDCQLDLEVVLLNQQ